jgi:thioredoxin 1
MTTDANFIEETSTGLVLVDFWADWCAPCKALLPILDELENIKVCKHDIFSDPEAPTRFNVRTVPTLVLLRDGNVLATRTGAATKAELEEWINAHNTRSE